jgi:hypothetical protein
MDDFRPISLCNCIYKVVEKVIARRIKSILSSYVSKETIWLSIRDGRFTKQLGWHKRAFIVLKRRWEKGNSED